LRIGFLQSKLTPISAAVGNEAAVIKHMSFEQMFVFYSQAAEKFTVPVRQSTELFGWNMNRLGSIVVNFKKRVSGIIAPLRIKRPAAGVGDRRKTQTYDRYTQSQHQKGA
jgi:hypothetical protein